MNSYNFDAIILGNGTTLNLLDQLKPYIENGKLYLLNIDEFLKKLIKGRLSLREEKKIFKVLYEKKNIENIKYFEKLKHELDRFYLKNDSNIEKIIGRDMFLGINSDVGYDMEIIKTLFPALYNIWLDILYEYIVYMRLEKYIEAFYWSIKSVLTNNSKVYTTNFDYFADNNFNTQHLHGKFIKGIRKYEDVVLDASDKKEFYFKHVWGWNGIGKNNFIQEISNFSNANKYFDTDFFNNENINIYNLLIYGLSFQRSGYITDEFLKEYPKYKKGEFSGNVIDEHILIRIKELQNLKQLNNIVIAYYSEKEKDYFEVLLRYYEINNTEIIHASEFNFKIE